MDNVRPLVIALGLALVASPAIAQQRVYQWKDAKGVTHYTDMPPADAHKTRDIYQKSESPAEVATAKPVESQQCRDARGNMLRLNGAGGIGIDTDGDGKPDRNMTADERARHAELNAAALKAYCPPSSP